MKFGDQSSYQDGSNKNTSSGSLFYYDSLYWTNNALLHPASPLADNEDAKYDAYLNHPFNYMKVCRDANQKTCWTYKFGKIYKNAKELFSGPYINTKEFTTKEQAGAFWDF